MHQEWATRTRKRKLLLHYKRHNIDAKRGSSDNYVALFFDVINRAIDEPTQSECPSLGIKFCWPCLALSYLRYILYRVVVFLTIPVFLLTPSGNEHFTISLLEHLQRIELFVALYLRATIGFC